jgi:hypothetical protein
VKSLPTFLVNLWDGEHACCSLICTPCVGLKAINMSRNRAYQMCVSKVVAADSDLTQVCTEPVPRWANIKAKGANGAFRRILRFD